MRTNQRSLKNGGAIVLASLLGFASCTYTESEGAPTLPEGVGAALSPADDDPTEANFEGALAFAVEGLADRSYFVANTENGLNIRNGPGTTNETQGLLAPGTLVTTTGESADVGGDRWFEITTGELRGWVHSGYLLTETDYNRTLSTTPVVTSTWPAGTTLVVAVNPGANLRDRPAGDVIVGLTQGEEVIATGAEVDGWVPVKAGTLDGWILAELLERQSAEGQAQPFGNANIVTPGQGLDGVNIRSAPNGTIITGVPAGEDAELTGNVAGDWVEITYRNVTGWALAELLVSVDDPAATTSQSTATINRPGDIVAVYLEPAFESQILTSIPHGETVATTGVSQTDGWSQVMLTDSTIGWVQSVFLAS